MTTTITILSMIIGAALAVTGAILPNEALLYTGIVAFGAAAGVKGYQKVAKGPTE